MLLHLRDLLDLRSSPTVLSARLLITQSNPNTPPLGIALLFSLNSLAGSSLVNSVMSCTYRRAISGGGAGDRTRVLHTFYFTSYNNNLYL